MTKKINNTHGLSDEQIKVIDNYKNEIKHIEGTINAVRAKIGMYLGSKHDQGWLNGFREIFQNSIDQVINPESPCNFVSVLYDERTYKFVIQDNGMGIPFDMIVQIYTEGHTGRNLTKNKKGDYTAGTNGIGAKVTNAVSSYFDVISYRYDGTAMHVRFEKGILKKKELLPNKDFFQGTRVECEPDHTILGETPLDPGRVYLLVRDTLSLLPIGTKIDYTSINKKGKVYHELMVNEDGIMTNIIGKSSAMLISPINIYNDTGEMKLEMSFTFDQQDLGGEDITAYANMCPTSTEANRNTHVGGVLDGICTWFCNYINKTFLTDKEKLKIRIMPVDVKTGLKLMISAWALEPIFTGQAKEIFSNVEFKPYAKSVVMNALDEWAKSKPQDLLKCCKFIKDIANVRIKTDSEKIKVTAKYETSSTSGLPSKYVRPTSKNSKEIELFIVEGDSALGTARNARDEKTQGIFPIRGKILNVFQATPQRIASNVEIASIIQILGAGYGKNFDINKMKVGKIIFMTDGDFDGSHIADLLLLVFLKMFPGLVESGRVYKAVPPLYGIPVKNKMQYFSERIDFVRYMQKEYYKKNTVTDIKGKPIDSATFSRLLIENSDYMYDFTTISERYKLNPMLLEIVLTSYIAKERLDTLKKRITSEFRFMENKNIEKRGSTIFIKGLINDRIETLFYNDRFIKDCEPLIEPIRKAMSQNHMLFKVNGKKVGLYELVSTAMASLGSVNRYKGLGEMNDWQLRESTMNPNTRTLIQYSIDDINETMKIIRQYDSNKKMILQRIGTVDRGDLIGL